MTVGVKENHFMTDPKETDRLIGRVLAGKIFFFFIIPTYYSDDT